MYGIVVFAQSSWKSGKRGRKAQRHLLKSGASFGVSELRVVGQAVFSGNGRLRGVLEELRADLRAGSVEELP